MISCDPSRRFGFLWASIGRTAADFPALTWENFVGNLVPVTIGNMIGGSIMVAAVYCSESDVPRAAPYLND